MSWRLAEFVADVGNDLDVAACAVVVRRDRQHALGLGFGLEQLAHLVGARRVGQLPLGIPVRGQPHPLLTDGELPQVEKNACSASTASANRAG
jgi:hypothetical protein